MNVPPIEPFLLPALEINRNLQAIQIRALLQNIAAYGASGFIINGLK
jgi:Haemolymph juvenile hormone binding protein (JHBP).